MNVRSWMVRSWPTVAWQAPQPFDDVPQFQHLCTEVRPERGPEGLTIGDTVWGAMVGQKGVLGIAWEWVELPCGVIAILDPNGVVSNAKFLTEEGDEADELRAITLANVIAHSTPWQRVVISHLRKESTKPQQIDGPTTYGDAAIVSHKRTPEFEAGRRARPSAPPPYERAARSHVASAAR